MARLISAVGGAPVNDGERRVVQLLLDQLDDRYGVLPNVEVMARNGRRYEIDCVVTSPHAVYVVEIKAYARDVVGDGREWMVGDRVQAAPIRLTTQKARVLKGLLQDELPLLGRAWVEPLVVLADQPSELDLTASARRQTVVGPEVVEAVQDPDRLPHGASSVDQLAARAERVLQSVVRRRSGPRVIGQWEVVETLEDDGEVAQFRAVDRFARYAPPRRLTVTGVSPYRFTPDEASEKRQQLVREYTALAHMGPHPNIVGAHQAFEEGDAIVVVSDEPEGVSLGILLGEGLDITDDERLTFLDALVAAVSHAHAHSVVHRRITPEAVMISGTVLRLGGFGSAHIATEGTIFNDPTAIDADLRYLAPEIVDPAHGPISAAADIFGVAALACALWSGAPPWPETKPAAREPPQRPDVMPDRLWLALRPMLEIRPSDRPTSLADLRGIVGDLRSGGSHRRPPLEYAIDEVIDDRYVVLAKLGSGAFSTVYQVLDTVADQDVALKVFLPSYGLETVQRELQALRSVRHPNVVEVIDAGQTSTRPRQWFIKSHLARGTSLEAFTSPATLLPPEVAVRVVDQLLDACAAFHPNNERIAELEVAGRERDLTEDEYHELQGLHGSGLVHRDIKPQNVMYDVPTGQTALLDFNIASPVGGEVLTVAGTPGYQPPDADLTRWSVTWDLFALGILLFELLTGQHPYEDRRPALGARRSLRELRPELPAPLDAFCARACADASADRFGTAREMQRALRSAFPAAGAESVVSDLEPVSMRPVVAVVDVEGQPVEVAVEQTDPVGGARWVLSATTLDGRTYPAPHGARIWLPDRRPLTFAAARDATWRLALPGADGAASPRLVSDGQPASVALVADAPAHLHGVPVSVHITIRDQNGDAIVDVALHQADQGGQDDEGDEAGEEPSSGDDPSGGLPTWLVDFIRSRARSDQRARELMTAFVRAALERAAVRATPSTSVKSADGMTEYFVLHLSSSEHDPALAYVKPGVRAVDLRLPPASADGHRFTEVMAAGNREYRVRVRLDHVDAVEEAVVLLDQAVARTQASGSPARPPSATASSGRDLARELHDELVGLGRRIMRETPYTPSLFIQMLQGRGGLATAQYLLGVPKVSSGFTTLWELGRLDLTVEAVVLQPEWRSLFTDRELAEARKRLRDHGHDVR